MEQPSAIQSVDCLGQTHKWADTDVISSYKEVYKQLDVCQKKLREESEPKGQKKLEKSSSHSEQLSQKAAQQAQQFQCGGVAAIGNIGNISRQLKQHEESTLHAEEKRMGPLVGCVGKG